MSNVRFIGLDVHAETIAVAVAEPDGEVRSLGVIPNRPESIRKLVKKLGPAEQLRVCYEAGPTGYVVYWQLTALGVTCEVVAPTLGARQGRRSREDGPPRRAEAGAQLSGRRLDAGVGAGRGARSAARSGPRPGGGEEGSAAGAPSVGEVSVAAWTTTADRDEGVDAGPSAWVKSAVHFDHAAQEATLLDYIHEVDHVADRITRLEGAIDAAVKTAPARMRAVIEALQALRGIALVSAVTIAAEVGELSRFAKPRQLMGYSGAVASEHSSGKRTRRGGITKTGNAHLRRVVVEAAWAYRHRPAVGARASKAPGHRQCRGERDRVEGATPVARPLPPLDRARQM